MKRKCIELNLGFRKKTGGTPYYPDNSSHLDTCALVGRILASGGRVLSWTGGRKEGSCAGEGLDTRIVARLDLPEGKPDPGSAAENLALSLGNGFGPEFAILTIAEVEEDE